MDGWMNEGVTLQHLRLGGTTQANNNGHVQILQSGSNNNHRQTLTANHILHGSRYFFSFGVLTVITI
jgi:hypothetical protein